MKIPIPKEHGAWAMLYASFLVTVLIIGNFPARIVMFFLAMTALFFAHEPLVTLVRLNPQQPGSTEKFRQARLWFAIYMLLAALSGIPLLTHYKLWYLLPFGALSVLLLFLHILLVSKRAERFVPGEFLGVLSLTSTAPAAYYVLQGQFDNFSFLLWLLNLLYFTSGIFYVKMRVSRYAKKSEAASFTLQCGLYHMLLPAFLVFLIWLGWLPLPVLLGFVPVVLRAFWGMTADRIKLNLTRIGFAEVAFAVLFVVFLTLGFRM